MLSGDIADIAVPCSLVCRVWIPRGRGKVQRTRKKVGVYMYGWRTKVKESESLTRFVCLFEKFEKLKNNKVFVRILETCII